MSLWAIVPVKPLRRGKSRLSGILSEEERTQLNYQMLVHTLDVIAQVPAIEHTLVVSRDPSALTLARQFRARTLQEDGNPHLNTALRRATMVAQLYAPSAVLILPADLPLLRPADLQDIIDRADSPPVIAIAPDRCRQGTNALLINPPGLIDYAFGPGSYQKHCDRAVHAGARLEICEIPTVALDLDTPEDLETIRQFQTAELL